LFLKWIFQTAPWQNEFLECGSAWIDEKTPPTRVFCLSGRSKNISSLHMILHCLYNFVIDLGQNKVIEGLCYC
jgi:hypothetical protein